MPRKGKEKQEWNDSKIPISDVRSSRPQKKRNGVTAGIAQKSDAENGSSGNRRLEDNRDVSTFVLCTAHSTCGHSAVAANAICLLSS